MHYSHRLSISKKYQSQKLIVYGLIVATIFILFGFIFSFVVFAWYAKNLPSPSKLSQAPSSS
ncbi:MAG: hypothetical protein ACPLRN_02650, partial [Microgenomates group bacterium]